MINSTKSRSVAFLLSFFLGAFGAHRFYVGKGRTGIVMLLLACTIIGLVVSGIWNLIDVITIALGKFTDGQGNLITKW